MHDVVNKGLCEKHIQLGIPIKGLMLTLFVPAFFIVQLQSFIWAALMPFMYAFFAVMYRIDKHCIEIVFARLMHFSGETRDRLIRSQLHD